MRSRSSDPFILWGLEPDPASACAASWLCAHSTAHSCAVLCLCAVCHHYPPGARAQSMSRPESRNGHNGGRAYGKGSYRAYPMNINGTALMQSAMPPRNSTYSRFDEQVSRSPASSGVLTC
jgi:hypothetical protein